MISRIAAVLVFSAVALSFYPATADTPNAAKGVTLLQDRSSPDRAVESGQSRIRVAQGSALFQCLQDCQATFEKCKDDFKNDPLKIGGCGLAKAACDKGCYEKYGN
jgi:hypothetical protein